MDLSRRAVLCGAGVGFSALAGCSLQSGPGEGTSTPLPTPSDPVQGQAKPVSAVCTDDTITTAAATATPITDTETPLPAWDTSACVSAGSERINEEVRAGLDGAMNGISTVHGFEDRTFTVRLLTMLNRDGEVISEPSVTVETVADVTPRTAEITYVYGEGSYERIVPVWVREMVIQEN